MRLRDGRRGGSNAPLCTIYLMRGHQLRRRQLAASIRNGSRLSFIAYYEPERGRETLFIQVPEIYLATKASTVAEIEGAVRQLVALALDVDPDAFDVRLQRAGGPIS